MFDTRDLDALKVNPQRQSHHGNNDASNHKIRFGDPCLSALLWHNTHAFPIDSKFILPEEIP
jgi:hypothetical protein